MESPLRISAVVITYNEERNITRCLESLRGLVDEMVVVDSYSKDRTVQIAKELGARVVQHGFEGHIEQKNWAIDQATMPYILSLDADEAISDELRASLLQLRNQSEWADAYTFNRLTNYCGQWIKHAGWYPDTKLRLWKKGKGSWGGINPHDRLVMGEGSSIVHLQGDLLHYSYYTVKEHLDRADKYADLGARHLYKLGKKPGFEKLYLSPLARFLKMYIFQLGFLEGAAGWHISRITTMEVLKKYRKLKSLWDHA